MHHWHRRCQPLRARLCSRHERGLHGLQLGKGTRAAASASASAAATAATSAESSGGWRQGTHPSRAQLEQWGHLLSCSSWLRMGVAGGPAAAGAPSCCICSWCTLQGEARGEPAGAASADLCCLQGGHGLHATVIGVSFWATSQQATVWRQLLSAHMHPLLSGGPTPQASDDSTILSCTN